MKTRHGAIFWLFTGALKLVWGAGALPAQEGSHVAVAAFRIPHTATPIAVTCSDTSSSWKEVPRITLSKDSLRPSQATADRPVAVLANITDVEQSVTSTPQVIRNKLATYQAHYAFQWDEGRLYGYVEIEEPRINANHPTVTETAFRASPVEAAMDDLFYSTVVVEVGAPSWQRWTTEMHLHVRPPQAKPMKSMFYGRTNDEENFHPLSGEAVACRTKGGWIAKFAMPWLPYTDWHPKPGVSADLRLLVPLAHAHEGFVVATVVSVVLTNP